MAAGGDFQRFVQEAHRRGIAVIVDAVYAHTADDFAYPYLYRRLGQRRGPFSGVFEDNLSASAPTSTAP